MGIMVYSLLWVMQDFVHQPYGVLHPPESTFLEPLRFQSPEQEPDCGGPVLLAFEQALLAVFHHPWFVISGLGV